MLAESEAQYAPYGWQAKIAFMLPSSCLVFEQEIAALTADLDGVIGIPARLPIETTDAAGLAEMNRHISASAQLLAGADPDVVVYMCTSGSFMDGNSGDAAIRDRIAALTTKPVTSTSHAVMAALEHLDISSVVLLSPYDDDVASREIAWLSTGGVAVIDHRNLDIRDNLDRGAFPPRESLRHALELDWGAADAVFLSCANVPYDEIVDELASVTDRHVVTSSLATTWHALQVAGVDGIAIDRRG